MALLIDEPAIHRRDAGVLRVTGADRQPYLHNLFSQHLQDAAPGTVADFLYLDAKGNAMAEGRAVVTAGAVVLVTPAAVTPGLADALARFTFLLDAATEDLSDSWAVASVRGPGPVDVLGARSEPMSAVPRDDGFVVRDRSGGVDIVGPAGWVDEQIDACALPLADADAWEAWRVGAGIPGWGTEIAEGRRPQELGLLPTHVHLRKGCYPGQESIAKIYNLGRPRRALAVLEMTGPVRPGDAVAVDGKTGEVTSAAPAGQAWVALALVPVGADGGVLGDGGVVVGEVTGRVRRRVGAELPVPGA
ncbi:MAG TPA: hypothetical protein VM307_10620 [Egibacteraceae bacterium]|nr:hypothetical protein [Egibacteraceae bacterium]